MASGRFVTVLGLVGGAPAQGWGAPVQNARRDRASPVVESRRVGGVGAWNRPRLGPAPPSRRIDRSVGATV